MFLKLYPNGELPGFAAIINFFTPTRYFVLVYYSHRLQRRNYREFVHTHYEDVFPILIYSCLQRPVNLLLHLLHCISSQIIYHNHEGCNVTPKTNLGNEIQI